MKLTKIFACVLFILLSNVALADTECFLAKENNIVLAQIGDCEKRHSPYATFKIALSLMGYDAGILIDETHPVWPFKRGYTDMNSLWEKDQNPQTWVSTSVVWYSQLITQKLGMAKLQHYVNAFNYGNKDLSGDPSKNNGLTNAWLGTSLQISPTEQVAFIQKILAGKIPVSKHAQEMTHNILYCEELTDGWKLYSKTGVVRDKEHPAGWDVGWIEKGNRHVVFVIYIEGDERIVTPMKDRVRSEAKLNLNKLIPSL